jgi:polyol permease family
MNNNRIVRKLFQSIGLPKQLLWGFIALFFFITGATLEQGWLSGYLVDQGVNRVQVSLIFTIYGVMVAFAAWITGVCTKRFGINRIMMSGIILYFLASVPLIFLAIPTKNVFFIMITYSLRGASYPLFAYSFLVMINDFTPVNILARAMSWFWTFFGLGMTVIGPFLSSGLIPIIGEIGTLLSGFFMVSMAAICTYILGKTSKIDLKENEAPDKLKDSFGDLFNAFTDSKLGISVIVKAINDIGKFGYVIIMPIYLREFGFSTMEWLNLWGTINILGLAMNYIFGLIGDKFGWRNTVMVFGGTFCFLGTLGLWISPIIFGHSIVGLAISLVFYLIGLGGFGPLSALIPNLKPENTAAGVSALNLGIGMSNLLGPLLVTIFLKPFGPSGALIGIAITYLLATPLSYFLKLPKDSN